MQAYEPVEPAYTPLEEQVVEELKADNAYDYPERGAPEPESWWDRLKAWLQELLDFSPNTAWWEYGLYLLIFVALMFALVRLLSMRFNGLFSRPKAAAPIDFRTGEEDIATLDFEEEISKALEQKNYALVVRLRYLQGLRFLSDLGKVQIKPDKTNIDYVYEIKEKPSKEAFAQLARLFDYIWYGEFNALEKHAEQSEELIKRLRYSQSKPLDHA